MKKLIVILALLTVGFAKKAPVYDPVPSPTPKPVIVNTDPVPEDSAKTLVTLGSNLGTSVDKAFANQALGLLNGVYKSGCLEREFLKYKFKSLNNVDGKKVASNEEALKRYLAGAPYALDLRWYYKRFSKVIGYTYNYKSDTGSGTGSETKIWSNTKYMDSAHSYASHLGHELSHQARAGGFVHYTTFEGSVPYGLNDIIEICLGL